MSDRIKIIHGDVSLVKAEAIVNAANTHLILGAGVAGAIRKNGGESIQLECNKLAPIGLGEVVITSAGNLPAKYVIHAATMAPGGFSSLKIIEKATKNIIHICSEKNLKSIALPAIGCGIAGVNLSDGIRVILQVIKNELKDVCRNLDVLYFTAFTKLEFAEFKKAADEILDYKG